MKIYEIIETIKKNCLGYGVIDESKTRDKVLYGNTDKECTGIVTTIYPSVEVIKKAHEHGANFIISHESTFWNHGDHTEWLSQNKSFNMKKELLDKYDITIWRNHDYIHSKLKYEDKYVDGIFYGLAKELDFLDYVNDINDPRYFEIPLTPTKDLIKYLMDKLGLQGIKTMGDLEGYSRKIFIPYHIIGQFDNEIIKEIEEKDIDTVLAMEITDFTVAIYIRDSAQLGRAKRILNAGHFNIEEPGMKWFANTIMTNMFPEIKTTFVKAGDSYKMILNK